MPPSPPSPPGAASPNFGFLAALDPLLAEHATRAERYLFDDPPAALAKLRLFGEALAQQTAARTNLYTDPQLKQDELLYRLKSIGALDYEVADLFHGLRKAGNRAVHENAGSQRDALHNLRCAWRLAVWFQRAFRDKHFKPAAFVPPVDPGQAHAALSQALAETQAQAAALAAANQAYQAQLAQLQAAAAAAPKPVVDAVLGQARVAAAALALTEAETRRLIDLQLREAGWDADSEALTHAAGTRPVKGKHLAIAEWPTENGPADYVLFAGLTPIAVVEAKRQAKDVPAAIEQAKRYGGPLAVPFLFATNGRPFLQQLRDKSGIWFLDARRPTNHARPLEGWYSPEGLLGLLAQDVAQADAKLAAEPTDYLGLRDYQIAAIRAVEAAVTRGQTHILLAMATGTGKTRTALGLIYRLVKSGRFRRILFLVDRTALGIQSHEVFLEVKLENLQAFSDIYDVRGLGDLAPQAETRLQLATIQGMVKRILFPSDDQPPPAVDTYDCVIIDECHRGYGLDREMSEAELGFRSEADYISKYRRVLDHFDATRIGLTATPALHTTEIFGLPVYQYSYRQAVIDGNLVDHRPPIRIVTELARRGITWKVGEEVAVYRSAAPPDAQIDLFRTPDEIHVDVDGFNTKVVTEAFNAVVCAELARHIDPSWPGKTLIFCATDAHADMVVRLLKEAFDAVYGEVEDAAVLKITGASDKPLECIKRFKNERLPNVAVTVDLMTTGIDVPDIVNLVFLRRVKSRILYEQMLGRATRTSKTLDKEFFNVFDAVDLYTEMQRWTAMKPVVTNPSITYRQLAAELATVTAPEHRQAVADQFAAKLQWMSRRLKPEQAEAFAFVAGRSLPEFTRLLADHDPAQLAAALAERPELAGFLDGVRTGDGRALLVSQHPDALIGIESGYGDGKKPGDYLEGFRQFLLDHQNDIAALKTVMTRPRDLTRRELKALALRLDQAGYPISALQTAWKELTNQDIAASLIGFIRQQALGSALVPYRDRVAKALAKLLATQPWTAPQRQWLGRIAEAIKNDVVVDRASLDEGQFRVTGGFTRLDKIFDGKLDRVLGDLHEALWHDTA